METKFAGMVGMDRSVAAVNSTQSAFRKFHRRFSMLLMIGN